MPNPSVFFRLVFVRDFHYYFHDNPLQIGFALRYISQIESAIRTTTKNGSVNVPAIPEDDENADAKKKHHVSLRGRWKRTSTVNKMIAIATIVSAASTLTYAVITYLQWRALSEQIAEIKKGSSDTHDLAVAAKRQADKSETISNSIANAVTALENNNKQAKSALDTTVRENRKALDASINAAQSEQRAYVTIGKPEGTVADILWPKDDKGNVGLLVYFQNNGRLPAKFNWGASSPSLGMLPADPTISKYEDWKDGSFFEVPTNHVFRPMYRAKSRTAKDVQWSGTIDIAGGSSYQGVLWEIPKERMLQFIRFENRMFMPSGRFEYCDGFGNRVCKNFVLSYAKSLTDDSFLSL
jgi:hypothetical protein